MRSEAKDRAMKVSLESDRGKLGVKKICPDLHLPALSTTHMRSNEMLSMMLHKTRTNQHNTLPDIYNRNYLLVSSP